MSRNAAGMAKALLENVGLNPQTISMCITDNPNNDEEAVQDGLIKWKQGQGKQPLTWAVVVEAMQYARIDQESIWLLKEELLKGMLCVLSLSILVY